MGRHLRDNNKPQKNKDGEGWTRLTRIINDNLENFRLSFSRCANCFKVAVVEGLNNTLRAVSLTSSPRIFEKKRGC